MDKYEYITFEYYTLKFYLQSGKKMQNIAVNKQN